MAKEVRFRITAVNAVKTGVAGAIKGFKRLGSVARSTARSVGRSFKSIAGVALRGVGAASIAAGAAIAKSIKTAADRETLRVQFSNLVKDAEKGATLLKQLVDFSDVTPFELGPIGDASKQLLAFGVSAEQQIPTLTKLGDAAATVGQDIGDVAFWFGRLKVASQQSGKAIDAEILNRFTEMGILTADVRMEMAKLSKEGKNAEAFQLFTKNLERFEGGMESLSQTLSGKVSTLKQKISNAMAVIGEAFSGDVKIALDGLISRLNQLQASGKVAEFAENVRNKLIPAFKEAAEFAKDLFGGEESRQQRIEQISGAVSSIFSKGAEVAVSQLIQAAPSIGEGIRKGFLAGGMGIMKSEGFLGQAARNIAATAGGIGSLTSGGSFSQGVKEAQTRLGDTSRDTDRIVQAIDRLKGHE